MPSTFYLYSAAVSRGGRNSIAPTSASPVRYQPFPLLEQIELQKQANDCTGSVTPA